jgi:hypothetical protein
VINEDHLASLDVAIAVFVYNRPQRTRDLLQSLGKHLELADIPIYVYSDGPKADVEGDAEKVGVVRDACRAFSRIKLVEHPWNIGLAKSIVSGVTQVLEVHREIIVLEDDLELASEFFDFMLTMLARYRGHPSVFHISGYMIPTRSRLPDLGLYRLPGSWGWATWRDKWSYYNHDIGVLIEQVRAMGISSFNVDDSFFHFLTLEENQTGARETWAIRWYASLYLNGGLSVYPHQSFVRNRGFGVDATNCKKSNKLYRVKLKSGRPFWLDCALPDGETPSYVEAYKVFHKELLASWAGHSTFVQRLRLKLKRLIKS